MLQVLNPLLLSWATFVLVRHYLYKCRLDKQLVTEGLVFSVIAYVVMYVYHQYMGYEFFDTNHGDQCPSGFIKVDDPINSGQKTCKPDPQGKALLSSKEIK